MLGLIALFSPRLRTALSVLREVEDVFVGIEELLRDQSGDPKVQKALNQMRDIRRKCDIVRGA